ncbi:hypothetical protein LR48_Vigan530s000500 [Vigna angularis]|uniref:Uncharacterized protein n=1 Tax=Phaseolus angularis TaxID=3914 RepID=A0A0L9TCT5_PHAAN|nr:hypothetical protein LR48_Vigan530s000500 [Vigna angularis]
MPMPSRDTTSPPTCLLMLRDVHQPPLHALPSKIQLALAGFKVNLMKEVKKDRDGIRKELKKCKRREAASTAQRQLTTERHSRTPVGSAEG